MSLAPSPYRIVIHFPKFDLKDLWIIMPNDFPFPYPYVFFSHKMFFLFIPTHNVMELVNFRS